MQGVFSEVIPIRKSNDTLFYLIGIVPVVWLALLLAQSLGGGLPELLRNLTSALEQPTNIVWTDKSLPTILICLAAYGMAVLLYRTNQGRTRDGEEHGSAVWATPASVNAQFAQKDSIPLTQHVRLGLDTHKHRRSLNVLVIGGSGAAKTRSFVLPNILTANTNYVITDPKSEVLLATGGYLKEQGYYSADQIHHGPLPRHVRFVLDEFAAMPLPGFTRELATMRSRSISASVIIQNMAQIKELYKDSWETIPGNCDTILYLGGNESSTHKYVSEMLGKATIDTKTHGQTKGKSGSYSTNFQMSGRELLTPDEVRKLDNRYALLFIRGASPVMDEKYDLMHHPAISHSSLGGAAPYIHHGIKPAVYTGRPLLRVGSTENLNPLKEEFH